MKGQGGFVPQHRPDRLSLSLSISLGCFRLGTKVTNYPLKLWVFSGDRTRGQIGGQNLSFASARVLSPSSVASSDPQLWGQNPPARFEGRASPLVPGEAGCVLSRRRGRACAGDRSGCERERYRKGRRREDPKFHEGLLEAIGTDH